jgi:hypothetical protein
MTRLSFGRLLRGGFIVFGMLGMIGLLGGCHHDQGNKPALQGEQLGAWLCQAAF